MFGYGNDKKNGFDIDSDGDIGIPIGSGMTLDSDGDIGFDLGNGLTIDTDGDIGFKFWELKKETQLCQTRKTII